MNEISEDSYMLIQRLVVGFVILIAWFLFLRTDFLEKDLPEENKSLFTSNCATSLVVTLGLLMCFVFTDYKTSQSLPSGVWLIPFVLSMMGYVLLIKAYVRVLQAQKRKW